jgi:hypothetical protein
MKKATIRIVFLKIVRHLGNFGMLLMDDGWRMVDELNWDAKGIS